MLTPFNIHSTNQRFPDGAQAKGYRRSDFERRGAATSADPTVPSAQQLPSKRPSRPNIPHELSVVVRGRLGRPGDVRSRCARYRTRGAAVGVGRQEHVGR